MGSMMIDGRRVEFTDEPNVLAVIRKAGIDIPTLCYHSELSIYGACRLCTVENEWGKTFASCSEKPKDGMVIYTNTPRLIKYRKQIIELLLASHCRDCTTCIKSGECHLQELAHRSGVQIETPLLKKLCQIAEEFGGAAKTSGAGGGDCGIVAIDGHADLPAVLDSWTKSRIEHLPLSVYFVNNIRRYTLQVKQR